MSAVAAPLAAGEKMTPQEADLLDDLNQGAQIEHLLALQYLFAAFSLKKYPGEFAANPTPEEMLHIEAQIERNRRWSALLLYVARQEMEHLCMVENMFAILDREPFLWRPNFPVPHTRFPVGPDFSLRRFDRETIEIFRYYEKPCDLPLPMPPHHPCFPGVYSDPDATHYDSVQALYEHIQANFDYLFKGRYIQGRNPNRVVNEHFGFNISLDPVIIGQYELYVDQIIAQILEEGEGVGGAVPPLGSHFMSFQKILSELDALHNAPIALDCALPVVQDPTIFPSSLGGYIVTNDYSRQVMTLYDDCYILMTRLLTGFFWHYDVDQTTGIHPPIVNAYFQTAFYPFMTMIMRPLGEIVTRLPADAAYVPEPGKLPDNTAGPSFWLNTPQNRDNDDEQRAFFAPHDNPDAYKADFERLSAAALNLSQTVPPGYAPLGGRGYAENLEYIGQNLWRMGENFVRYWNGVIVAPIPSADFINFSDTTPFN